MDEIINEVILEVEKLMSSYVGAPAIDIIRDEIFEHVRLILDNYDFEEFLFFQIEELNDCLSGKFIVLPIKESAMKYINNINIRTL